MNDLQDAVTLAGELERTALQAAAKRVYDALCDALANAQCLRDHVTQEDSRAWLVERDVERAFDHVVALMHEDDCE